VRLTGVPFSVFNFCWFCLVELDGSPIGRSDDSCSDDVGGRAVVGEAGEAEIVKLCQNFSYFSPRPLIRGTRPTDARITRYKRKGGRSAMSPICVTCGVRSMTEPGETENSSVSLELRISNLYRFVSSLQLEIINRPAAYRNWFKPNAQVIKLWVYFPI
jgi:hypothetical protein